MVRQISSKVGGRKNLIFIGSLLALTSVLLLDVFVVDRIMPPLGYFYLLFALVVIFYGLYPLYTNRRLTRYYWRRTKRHRLSFFGLAFIIFLVNPYNHKVLEFDIFSFIHPIL